MLDILNKYIEEGKMRKIIEEEKMIKVDKLNKEKVIDILDEMYEIISTNMSNIIDTGNSKDDDYKNWKNSMLKELENPNKNWIGAFKDKELIGYFLYKINDNLVNLDEIQVKKSHQGDKYTFIKLFRYILNEEKIDDSFDVLTYVNNNNNKSNAIVKKFGFVVFEKKEHGVKYINSFKRLREKLEYYVIK